MKEGLLNHLGSDREPGQERAPRDAVVPPSETRERAEALEGERTGSLTKERTESLSREPTGSLTKARTEVLLTEPIESLTKGRTEALKRKRTESLSEEETDDSLDNGVGGTSEGSVQLESKAPSVSAGSGERLPVAPDHQEEPPVDWLEPLEEDDDEEDDSQSWDLELDLLPGLNGNRRPEEESLAGESERSGSLAGSERHSRKSSKSELYVILPTCHSD